jgi:hypothetical protein
VVIAMSFVIKIVMGEREEEKEQIPILWASSPIIVRSPQVLESRDSGVFGSHEYEGY